MTTKNLIKSHQISDISGETLATVVARIGSTAQDLRLTRGTYTVASNLTIPANINLVFEKGAIISVSATFTLTINGTISAGPYQIFTGAGDVTFGTNIIKMYSAWFANGDADAHTIFATGNVKQWVKTNKSSYGFSDYASSTSPGLIYLEPKENLLPNSGFGVWSNSTISNVGSAIASDTCAADGTADWADSGASATLAFDTDHYTFTTSAISQYVYWNNPSAFGAISGRLYRISVQVKDGTQAGVEHRLRWVTGEGSQFSKPLTTTGEWVTETFIFQASGTPTEVGIWIGSSMGGNNIQIRNFTLYEVTPACLNGDSLAMDGWYKWTNNIDIYREISEENTKAGSLYSCKMVSSGAGAYIGIGNSQELYPIENFRGKPLTFGCWLKTSTASCTYIQLSDGAVDLSSNYHTGGGDWEWFEVSIVCDETSSTEINVKINNDLAGTIYASHPMLVLGNYIGEGNYHPRTGEIIHLEKNVTSNMLNGTTGVSDVNWTDLNIEADTSGALPSNVRAVHIAITVNDSGSAAATNEAQIITGASSTCYGVFARPVGITNDALTNGIGWTRTNTYHDIQYYIDATGAGTFDVNGFIYTAVQLI